MKFLLGYIMKIVIWWGGGVKPWWGSTGEIFPGGRGGENERIFN